MKNLIAIILLTTAFNSSCKMSSEAVSNEGESKKDELIGFLFIHISDIYHNGGEIALMDENSDTLAYFKDSKILINSNRYDIIEEEHLYKKSINAETYDPEYGLFILNCYGKEKGFYNTRFNNSICLIKIGSDKTEFKSLVKYVLETLPVPTKINPLRQKASDKSDVISNFSDHSYLPIEVKGDWVKVKDDKECYPGEYPSEIDIVGWVRWRKDGVFILKAAYTC